MIRGLYTAASGMIAEMTRNDVIANNLANANTTGFKKDVALSKDFGSVLLERINDGGNTPVIGSMGRGSMIDQIATIHEAGSIRQTGNPLDLALQGDGFFAVNTPNGLRYTRNGAFTRSATGELVTLDGYAVQGLNGPIMLGDAHDVTITKDGCVFVGNNAQANVPETQVGQLQLTAFADVRQLVKEGATLYSAPPGTATQLSTAQVEAGALEMSNVNAVAEMVNMLNGYHAYETNAKMVQAQDTAIGKAVNDVGRLA